MSKNNINIRGLIMKKNIILIIVSILGLSFWYCSDDIEKALSEYVYKYVLRVQPTAFKPSKIAEVASTVTNDYMLTAYKDVDNFAKFVVYNQYGRKVIEETKVAYSNAASMISAAPQLFGNVMIAFRDVTNDTGRFIIYDAAGVVAEEAVQFGGALAGGTNIAMTNLSKAVVSKASESDNSLSITSGNVVIAYITLALIGKYIILDQIGNILRSESDLCVTPVTTDKISATTLLNGYFLLAFIYGSVSAYHIYNSQGDIQAKNKAGPPITFKDEIVEEISTTTLSNGNILIAYRNSTGGNFGAFVIVTPFGTEAVSEVDFNTADTSNISATALANGCVMITYTDNGDDGKGKFVVYDENGILVKAETEFESGSTTLTTATALSDGSVAVAYQDTEILPDPDPGQYNAGDDTSVANGQYTGTGDGNLVIEITTGGVYGAAWATITCPDPSSPFGPINITGGGVLNIPAIGITITFTDGSDGILIAGDTWSFPVYEDKGKFVIIE